MLLCLIAAVAFLVGIIVGTLTGLGVPGVFWLIAGVGLWVRPKIILILFCLGVGLWRVELWRAQQPELFLREATTLEGVLVEDFGTKNKKTSWVLETEWGRVLVRTSAFKELEYGDRVEVKGLIERVELTSDHQSYVHYLARHGIWLSMDDPQLRFLGRARAFFWKALFALSDAFTERLQYIIPEPEASLAVGLLLGRRGDMDQDLQEAFQVVGLTHIVAISGSNIAMVVAAFFVLFSFLPFYKRLVASGVGIILFVALVGPSAAVLRAGLMGLLSLLGLYTGRRSQALFALLWSAVFMVLWNPLILLYDVGFQLSFAATLGILLVVPMLDALLDLFLPVFEKSWLKALREALVLTVAAQISTLPFILYSFGTLSWITPLANLLVAPLIPLAMFFSGIALVFGTPGAVLASFFLMLIEKTALFLASIPGVQSHFKISTGVFVVMLLILSAALLLFYRSRWVRAFDLSSVGAFSRGLGHGCGMRETQ